MDKEEFQKLAELAGINIKDDEIDSNRSDFTKILFHIDKIQNIDIGDLSEQTSLILKRSEMRSDSAGESLSLENAIRNSKFRDDQNFIARNQK